MGECNYYLKARWAKPITPKTRKAVIQFLTDANEAYEFWQENRGGVCSPVDKVRWAAANDRKTRLRFAKRAAQSFWDVIRLRWPTVMAHLDAEGIPSKDGDFSPEALVGGKLCFCSYPEELASVVQVDGCVLRYGAKDIYDNANWDGLCRTFCRQFGALEAVWADEESLGVTAADLKFADEENPPCPKPKAKSPKLKLPDGKRRKKTSSAS